MIDAEATHVTAGTAMAGSTWAGSPGEGVVVIGPDRSAPVSG
jgi:hypothetical protein